MSLLPGATVIFDLCSNRFLPLVAVSILVRTNQNHVFPLLAKNMMSIYLKNKKSMSKRVVWLSIRSLVFVNELFVYQSSPVALHAVFDG